MTIHSDGSNARLVEPGVRAFGGSWSVDGSQVLTRRRRELEHRELRQVRAARRRDPPARRLGGSQDPASRTRRSH